MPSRTRRRWPHPRERTRGWRAQQRTEWLIGRDVLPVGSPCVGPYAERPEYSMPRGELDRPRPDGSGWPHPVHVISRESAERQRRALEDYNIARGVDAAIYHAIGPAADALAIYACDGEVAVEGRVESVEEAHWTIRAAWDVPGVRQVHDLLEVMDE